MISNFHIKIKEKSIFEFVMAEAIGLPSADKRRSIVEGMEIILGSSNSGVKAFIEKGPFVGRKPGSRLKPGLDFQ